MKNFYSKLDELKNKVEHSSDINPVKISMNAR